MQTFQAMLGYCYYYYFYMIIWFIIKCSNMNSKKQIYIYIYIYIVRTRFGLNPKEEWIQAYKTPNNKFVECGIKSQSESRAKILDYRLQRKELYVHICTKSILRHALVFFPPLLAQFFLRIIYYGFFTVFSIHVWIRRLKSLLFYLSCLFLNLPFLAVRLRVHCSGITSTLMRPEGQLGSI